MDVFFALTLSMRCHFLSSYFGYSSRWIYMYPKTIYICGISIVGFVWSRNVFVCMWESFGEYNDVYDIMRVNLEDGFDVG